MKIFLRSPNWIGDCVMSLPAVRALKSYRPDLELIMVTKSHLSAVYKNIKEISETVLIPPDTTPGGFIGTVLKLRSYRVKEGILFPNSFRSALEMRLSGVGDLTGYSRDNRGWMLKRRAAFPGKSIHQIRSYSRLIGLYLRCKVESDFSNRLVFSEDERREAEQTVAQTGLKTGDILVGVSPAAAYGSSKEWPSERFVELIGKVSAGLPNAHFVLFGSGRDENKLKEITDSLSASSLVVGGDYSLRQAMAVISICDIFIGNDSGLLHVADAAGIPSIGLFGPTSPGTTAPPGRNTETVYKAVDCSPCSFRECPVDHRCMRNITADEISGKVLAALK